MDTESLFELYKKERDYQRCCFGEYENLTTLNFASFLLFVEEYLVRAKKGYSGKWESTLPAWLLDSIEMSGGSAPVDAYDKLIKVFILAGAALETYTNINPDEWRKNPQKEISKWKK